MLRSGILRILGLMRAWLRWRVVSGLGSRVERQDLRGLKSFPRASGIHGLLSLYPPLPPSKRAKKVRK